MDNPLPTAKPIHITLEGGEGRGGEGRGGEGREEGREGKREGERVGLKKEKEGGEMKVSIPVALANILPRAAAPMSAEDPRCPTANVDVTCLNISI